MPTNLSVELHSRLSVLSEAQFDSLFSHEPEILPAINKLSQSAPSDHSITVFCDHNPVLYIPVQIADVPLKSFIKEPDFIIRLNSAPQKFLWLGKIGKIQGCLGIDWQADSEILDEAWGRALEVLTSLVTAFEARGIVLSLTGTKSPPMNKLEGFMVARSAEKCVIFKLTCPWTSRLLAAARSSIQPA